ncbi:MAG: hypothetical protein E7282_05080 [Lachnospiraceae bacterium]|nr:hypothetical protein [Lachnospiraceae bacterium]
MKKNETIHPWERTHPFPLGHKANKTQTESKDQAESKDQTKQKELKKPKKPKNPRKKMNKVTRNLIIAIVALTVVVGILGTALAYTDVALRRMSAQMNYMQDTVSVINSNLDNLGTNIAAQLEEETSLVEDYSVTLKTIDFASKTYTVDLMVVPKEYTESTETSVFFGTKEFTLDKDGFTYTGEATLPINQSYEGNMTVLFTNGASRSTEIIKYYRGIDIKNQEYMVVTEDVEETIGKEGLLSAEGTVTLNIDGCDLFSFERLEYVLCSGDEELYTYDLLKHELDLNEDQTAENKDKTVSDTDQDAASAEPVASTETETEDVEVGPVDEVTGTYTIDYQLEEPLEDLEELTVKIRAYTTEGYEMDYELSHMIVRVTTEESGDKEVTRYALTDDLTQSRYFFFMDLLGGKYKKAL